MFWKTKHLKEYEPSIYDIKNILERKLVKGSTSLSVETTQRLAELVEENSGESKDSLLQLLLWEGVQFPAHYPGVGWALQWKFQRSGQVTHCLDCWRGIGPWKALNAMKVARAVGVGDVPSGPWTIEAACGPSLHHPACCQHPHPPAGGRGREANQGDTKSKPESTKKSLKCLSFPGYN